MGKTRRSIPDAFGGYKHYDEKGHKTGESIPDMFGGFTDYDEKGKKSGYSTKSVFGGYDHYDSKGKKIGTSEPSVFGGYNHYDEHGKWTGSSDPDLFDGGSGRNSSGACYVATCVYGSYDCPEVRTLRRYRDLHLMKSIPGKLFVKCYYAVSPSIVRLFGKNRFIRSGWKRILDRFVKNLNRNGYCGTPYSDPGC